jgi:hypothetical protein
MPVHGIISANVLGCGKNISMLTKASLRLKVSLEM